MNKPKILVVGDVMLDHYVFGSVNRISPEAPVPVVSVTRDEHRPGGAGNVAMNLRELGCSVTLVTVTGADHNRDILFDLMGDIDRFAFRDPDVSTTTKLRVVSGQHLLRIDREDRVPNSRALRDVASVFADVVRDFDAVIMSDYDKGVLSNDLLTNNMMRSAKLAKVPVFVDPKGSNLDRYIGATAITPNLNELRAIVGPWADEAEMLHLASMLRQELHIQVMLLTRGEEGMTLLIEGCEPVTIPTVAQEVFDVSGAGDTVVAVFATMFVRGHNWFDSAKAANKAAGVVVGKRGTATASWDEIYPGVTVMP